MYFFGLQPQIVKHSYDATQQFHSQACTQERESIRPHKTLHVSVCCTIVVTARRGTPMSIVKINNQKPQVSCRGRSHSLPLCQLPQTGKNLLSVCNRKFSYSTAPSGRRTFSWPDNTQPMESLYTSDGLTVSSNELLVYNSPSALSLSSLWFWDSAGFTIRSHILNSNSWLFPNKPILLENYLAGYLLMLDTINW